MNEALLLPGAGCLWLFSAACGCWAQMPGGLSHCAGLPQRIPAHLARVLVASVENVSVFHVHAGTAAGSPEAGLGQGAHFRGGKHLS